MLVFFAALLSSAAAANICCSPDQWQADVGLVMGSVSNGKTSFIEGMMRTSYDATNQIEAYDQVLNVDGYEVKQRIVSDFKNGVMYTIRDGSCNRTKIGNFVPSCIPGNATELSANTNYGLGSNAVNVKAYNTQFGGYDVNIAITSDTCVPVSEVITGQLDPVFAGRYTVEVMQVLTFANVKGGIANRDVFFVPAQCENVITQTAVGRRSVYFNH